MLVSGVIFTFGLFYLGYCPSPEIPGFKYPFPFENGEIRQRIYDVYIIPYRIQIALFFAVAIALVQIVLVIKPSETRKKMFILLILQRLLKHYFEDDSINNRITIYKISIGYRLWPRHFWQCFVRNFHIHRKKGLLRTYLLNFPIPWEQYTYNYLRLGPPKNSSTLFKVPKSDGDVHGIVSQAILYPQTHSVTLPDVSNIDFNVEKFDSLSSTKRKTIKKYIANGKLNGYEDFKRYHRLPTRIWATPIYYNEKIWGVFVVDSIDKFKDIESIQDGIISYMQLTETVINKL